MDPSSIQGFADDLADVIAHKDMDILHNKAQTHIDFINAWCYSVGLEINTSKTKIILFSSKRNLSLPLLHFGNTPISYSRSTKFLGITIDSKLRFTTHVNNIVSHAITKFNISRRFIGTKWGISHYASKWCYESIVQPTLTYGSLIWYSVTNKKYISQKLHKVDSRALRSITRAFKSCPPHVLYTLTNITPIGSQIFKSSLFTLYRLASSPNFNLDLTHNPNIKHLLSQIESLNLPRPTQIDLIQHKSNFYRYFTVTTNHNLSPDFFNSPEFYYNIPNLTYNIFTDGSKTSYCISAGFIIYSHNHSPVAGKVFLHPYNSVFQAEAVAISQALSLHIIPTLNQHSPRLLINIFSDSSR